jgi:hypothetical protein
MLMEIFEVFLTISGLDSGATNSRYVKLSVNGPKLVVSKESITRYSSDNGKPLFRVELSPSYLHLKPNMLTLEQRLSVLAPAKPGQHIV